MPNVDLPNSAIHRTVKPDFGKELKSDPELADFIWNGFDALLPINQTIECTNKAHLDQCIKSTFGAMCIKKLRECQNVLNNQFREILGKFLQVGRFSESMMF